MFVKWINKWINGLKKILHLDFIFENVIWVLLIHPDYYNFHLKLKLNSIELLKKLSQTLIG